LFHKKKYTIDILKKFKMDPTSPIRTPIIEHMVMKKVSSEEFVDPTYFKSIVLMRQSRTPKFT